MVRAMQTNTVLIVLRMQFYLRNEPLSITYKDKDQNRDTISSFHILRASLRSSQPMLMKFNLIPAS